jgi:hypothetical protein
MNTKTQDATPRIGPIGVLPMSILLVMVELAVAAVLLLAAPAAPAHAVQNNGGGETVTIESLEKQGYKCEVVSVGFVECTKKGEKTYWCSRGSCAPAPRTTTSTNPLWSYNGSLSPVSPVLAAQ